MCMHTLFKLNLAELTLSRADCTGYPDHQVILFQTSDLPRNPSRAGLHISQDMVLVEKRTRRFWSMSASISALMGSSHTHPRTHVCAPLAFRQVTNLHAPSCVGATTDPKSALVVPPSARDWPSRARQASARYKGMPR
jgi:hypothetical protein